MLNRSEPAPTLGRSARPKPRPGRLLRTDAGGRALAAEAARQTANARAASERLRRWRPAIDIFAQIATINDAIEKLLPPGAPPVSAAAR
jgi:hypothetical protein